MQESSPIVHSQVLPVLGAYTRSFLGRLAEFLACFLGVPLIIVASGLLIYGLGGLRGSSFGTLIRMAWVADPGYFQGELGRVALAGILLSSVLATLSFLGWRLSERYSMVRVVRFVALLWLVATIMHPGVLWLVPLVRRLPWIVPTSTLFCITCVMHLWRRAQARPRELAFNLLGVALVLVQFPRATDEVCRSSL